MKGIVLAGGSGTRLHPITKGISKQLLPIYDKPMIYYPISVLMLAGIRDILIITTPKDLLSYKKLLGDGSNFGVQFEYIEQLSPEGLAQAFILGEKFIGKDDVCLILGDNLFWGHGFTILLEEVVSNMVGATIFGYAVKDPKRFGVIEFDNDKKIISIEEKPKNPKSDFAVTGLYFYNNDVVEISKSIKPSKRGELEITSINQIYLEKNMLSVEILGRGFAWLDMGTCDSLIEGGTFVQTIEQRQGYKIACLEEIAYLKEWIDEDKLRAIIGELPSNSYSLYLSKILKN